MLESQNKQIYLASNSPRRRDLLEELGIGFEPIIILGTGGQQSPGVNENRLGSESPKEYVERLALKKAEAGWYQVEKRGLLKRPVMGADTTVALGSRIFSKPQNTGDAFDILQQLSGRTHFVYTGVALRFNNTVESIVCETEIMFRDLTDKEIRKYIASGEPMDKAGAYAIQGKAGIFVKKISGSYSCVVGLPLYETSVLLKKFGIDIL